MHFWHQLFSSGNYEPHGYCYLWNPPLVWLHVASDALIALAYFSIPVTLVWFVRRRRDLPFSWMFLLFGVFIVACGSTHAMEVWNLWHGMYWLAGALKAVTAAASVPTAILLAKLVPEALDLPNSAQWIKANAALQREIQERRDMEVILRISEGNYREQAELLDLTHDAIFVRNLDGKIVYWNLGAERLYGWRKDEVRGKASHELLRTQFPRPDAEILADVCQHGYWEGELIHRRRDGSELTVSSRWALRKDSGGKPLSILESNRDITHRKRVEERFRNLLESAPDAIVIVEDNGKIQLVNAQTEKLFGYSRAELLGQPVEFLVPECFHRQHAADRQAYSTAPHARAMGVGLELFGRKKDGSEFPVEVSLSPLQTDQGTLVSSTIRDVSIRRRTEDEIRKLNTELSGKIAELSLVNKELESFSYSVSHDLRTPLRHIDGFARILKDEHSSVLSKEGKGYLDRALQAANHTFNNMIGAIVGWADLGIDESEPGSRLRRHFEKVRHQAERAAGLTRQLLAFARRQILEPRDIDINQSVVETLSLLEKVIGSNIEIKANLASDLNVVRADPTQVEQVLMNFCINARDAMPDGGSLIIESANVTFDEQSCARNPLASPGKYAMLSVTDTGTGIDSATLGRIFEPFFTTKRFGKGTGLGLATVYGIARQHGGLVDVQSELHKGSTFRIYLPVSVTSTISRTQPEDHRVVRGGTETILIAEDHDGLREIALEILTNLGYRVLVASDGEQALREFRDHHSRIDLALLDVMLPKFSGPEVYARISSEKPDLRVIFATGYSADMALLNQVENRGLPVIQKPYSPRDLARKVREILDGSGVLGAAKFEIIENS